MLKTITLAGSLGKKYGRVHRLDCADALDALRAFCAMLPGFQQDFVRLKYRVVLNDAPMTNREELKLPAHTIRFVPVVSGAGHGIGEVVAGALLLVAAFYAPELAVSLGATAAEGAAAGSMAFSLGASMVLTGLAQAIAQPPLMGTNSYLFSGPVNSTKQGNPVPILYGTLMIGSQVISANLQAYDIAIGPPTTNTTTSTSISSNGTITTVNQSVSKGAV